MDNKPKATAARLRATAKYEAKTYTKITFRIRKENEEELRSAAAAACESVNGYIWGAVKARMESERK